MIIFKESVLTDEKEIQERINEFVTYVNKCLEENARQAKEKTA